MLSSLHIENIAVVRKLDLPFDKGFTAVTGETGAGKSIIIDSIKLILGAKASRELIRTGENEAEVSALFCDISSECSNQLERCGFSPDENGELMLYRSISSDGRSIARINGRSVPLTMLKAAGQALVGMYGQNDSILLMQTEQHIGLLDAYAGNEQLINEYKSIYQEINSLSRRIKDLYKDGHEKERQIEMLKFQINEISQAKLKRGEEEILEAQKLKIKNAEKLLKHSKLIYRALYSNEKGTTANALIDIAKASLEQMNDVFPEAGDYITKLTAFQFELEEIAEKAASAADTGCENPEEQLNYIESRLDTITKLKRKYGQSVEEILSYLDKCKIELEETETSDSLIAEYSAKAEKLYANAIAAANKINYSRSSAAAVLEENIMRELSYLDLEKVKFKVQIDKSKTTAGKIKLLPDGTDTVEFLISTNTGEPLKPLSKIASGGELSRIMLALKCVFADREGTQTLIFDEIDTGISGKTSQKIGFKLRQIAGGSQVFCVTHSAQIASVAENHFKVTKNDVDGRTETSITRLSGEERVNEIARIMGGVNITEKIKESAREMLASKA